MDTLKVASRSIQPVGAANKTYSVDQRLESTKTPMDFFTEFFPHSEVPEFDFDSSSTLINDVSKGIIKDPFTFDYKVHEKCPTPPPFTDEQRKTVDRFWRDAYLKSLSKAVHHVQDWFTKISFSNKVKFTGKAIESMVDSRKLFDLAYFIGPPTKDYVYSHTQFTRSAPDVAATDHNRGVDDATYDAQSGHYLEWFRSLNPREQFDAVIGLIHLGGTALEEKIYGRVVRILEEKERDVIRRRVLQYLANKREMGKFVASKVARHKHKLHQPVKTAKPKNPLPVKSELTDDKDYMTLLQEKIAAYDNAIKNMEKLTDGHIDSKPRKDKKARRSKSTTPGFGSKRLNRLNAGLDRVQMLPLWDNRRIIAMLPDRSSTDTAKVNKYWKEMVDRTKREIKVRKKINKFLSKESAEPKHVGGHKEDHKEHKEHKEHKTTKKTNHTEMKSRAVREEDIVPEDYHHHLDAYMVFTDNPPKLNPFANPPETYLICNEYCDDRAMDANKRWAGYSKKTDVGFCNVVFGVPCNIKLEDAHTSRISRVCFHPNDGSLIFTGGYDGYVKLHDVWKKTVKKVYAGHKGIVNDVAANCRYVASCGTDNTIRVFNISDGRSMMCLTEDKLTPCRLLMTDCAHPLLYVASMHGEIIMYSIRGTGGPQKIGKTLIAHRGEVTSLNHYPCFLLTTGVDGFARLWTTNFEKPFWVVSLKHPLRVNSAAMSHRKILSASEDGKLRIWDVMTGGCEKTINITPTGRPILSMNCIQGPNAVKIVLNNEADIRIVEFTLRKPVSTKKLGRYRGSKLKPIGDFKKKISPVRPIISSYDKRMMKLQMRQAVLPPIRPSQSLPPPPLLQDRMMDIGEIEVLETDA